MTKKCQELKGKSEEKISDAQSELTPKKDEKETVLTFLLGDDDDGVSSRGEEVHKFLQEKQVPSDINGLGKNSDYYPLLASLTKQYLCVPATWYQLNEGSPLPAL